MIRQCLRYPAEEVIVRGSRQHLGDFLYVDDVVDALLLMHDKGMNKGVISVGSGEGTTRASLVEVRPH